MTGTPRVRSPPRQEVLEKQVDRLVRLRCRVVVGAVGHADAVVVAEEAVDGDRSG